MKPCLVSSTRDVDYRRFEHLLSRHRRAARRYRRLQRRALWKRRASGAGIGFLVFAVCIWALAGFFSELVGAYR